MKRDVRSREGEDLLTGRKHSLHSGGVRLFEQQLSASVCSSKKTATKSIGSCEPIVQGGTATRTFFEQNSSPSATCRPAIAYVKSGNNSSAAFSSKESWLRALMIPMIWYRSSCRRVGCLLPAESRQCYNMSHQMLILKSVGFSSGRTLQRVAQHCGHREHTAPPLHADTQAGLYRSDASSCAKPVIVYSDGDGASRVLRADELQIHSAAQLVGEGRHAKLRVLLRDLLQPLHAGAAGLEGVEVLRVDTDGPRTRTRGTA